MIVFEFPPRLSFNSHVKTESRYGMKRDFLLPRVGLGLFEANETSAGKEENTFAYLARFSITGTH